VGDAIAISLMKQKGFSEENFRYNHPGGSIGKRLLKVRHVMHSGDELPVTGESTTMTDVLKIIDEKRFGVVIVTDDSRAVKGVITDGDLRRHLIKGVDFSKADAAGCMTKNPLSIGEDNLAVEALKIMEDKLITSLVVTENNILKGMVHLHDLWRTEMI